MPVATQAALKGLSQQQTEELGIPDPLGDFIENSLSKLGISLILNNTYHLNLRPGTKILEKAGGAHEFQGWRRNMLTVCAQEHRGQDFLHSLSIRKLLFQDSGGFQLVSLSGFTQITEEGALFASPFTGEPTMLTPEESISIQV